MCEWYARVEVNAKNYHVTGNAKIYSQLAVQPYIIASATSVYVCLTCTIVIVAWY